MTKVKGYPLMIKSYKINTQTKYQKFNVIFLTYIVNDVTIRDEHIYNKHNIHATNITYMQQTY